MKEYKQKQKEINNSEKEIKLLMNSLEKRFGIIDLKRTQQYLHERTKKKLEETVKIHEKKLKELNGGPVGQNYLAMRTKVVHNLSTYQPSEGEERVLARGWEFCIERKLTNSTDLKTELEVNAQKLEEITPKKYFKTMCLEIGQISMTLIKHVRNKNFCNISREEFLTLKKLRENKNIVICEADKGNSVVILDKKD